MKTAIWIVLIVVCSLVCAVVAFILGGVRRKKVAEKAIGSAEAEASRIVTDAMNEAEKKRKDSIAEAKEESGRIKADANNYFNLRKNELDREQARIERLENNLNKRTSELDNKENAIRSKEGDVKTKLEEAEKIKDEQKRVLETISGYSQEQAKMIILQSVDEILDKEKAAKIREYEEATREQSQEIAQEILAGVIQRCSADSVSEIAVTSVAIPNDEMKARIIGREGRNVRAFESVTNTELIIDDTPDTIVISCFEPTKREIARIALEKLIADGRIHPGSIEAMYNKAKSEVEHTIKVTGERAAQEVGVSGISPDLIKTLGRLRYRTSYGQNVLDHSIEVAKLAGLLAVELHADVKIAKRAGLLHDIGKATDRDGEYGTHIDLGVELARRYHEKEVIVHAIGAHHGDISAETVYDYIIQTADAISAARPGARREDIENYIRRIESLERIAKDAEGVREAFAIQAGREVRVFVDPDQISDDKMVILAREVANRIGQEVQMPGQIKVQVIREKRHSENVK